MQRNTTTSQPLDDDNNDMPVLTPEVPIAPEVDDGPPVLEPAEPPMLATDHKSTSSDVNGLDLSAPPLLKPYVSPTLDSHIKLKPTNCEKQKKRKLKDLNVSNKSDISCAIGSGIGSDNGSDISCANILMSTIKPKKLKTSHKFGEKKQKMFSINKCKKLNKSERIQRELEESSEKLLKVLNNQDTKPKAKVFGYESFANASNVWSVDSNHTMSSMNTSQPYVKCTNFDETNAFGMDCAQSESLLAHNSTIFGNPLKFRQKMVNKSKAALNQSMRTEAIRSPRKSLHNELIGVTKPEPEVDVIDGIKFSSFESDQDMNLFTKFEQKEKEDKVPSDLSKKYKIKSFKQGKTINPTKTKDITKIKGWREKLFSSIQESEENQRPFTISKAPEESCSQNSNKNHFTSFIDDPSIGHKLSSDPKSAFVSDLLDGYLKTKSDLKLNYLSPDLAPPPEDSPIFSASVLKMPDTGSPSKPLPSTATSSRESTPVKRKFFKTKAIKNKSDSILNKSKPIQLDNDVPLSELLLPQYPVISDTLWPEEPLSEEDINHLCKEYSDISLYEAQQLKRVCNPSVTMDDNYARFALNTLQCNERTALELNESSQNEDDVLLAVGLAPKIKSPKSPLKSPKSPKNLSPIKDGKKTRKDKDADLAKMIAMGNRSKRQIRLPSRFHESSLLMGNQWIIPDYDQKGKTGKRRLQEEQKRLQELHQRQLEMEQRVKPLPQCTPEANNSSDEQLSFIHKNLPNISKLTSKPKTSLTNIPSAPFDLPIKIPNQRLKQMQLIRDQKKQSPKHKTETPKMDKGFTSLFSMSTQTSDNKRVLSLSAKAAASATQRAVVNNLFLELSETLHKDKNSIISRNGKLNKLETMKEALETINKLSKRDQQLSYIKKLLSMWNHKLQLCHKVLQKEIKPEAINVVNEVMNTYRSSMCYKVGEALEAKRKEFQEKRAQQNDQPVPNQTQNSAKKPQLSTGSQYITIPNANTKSFKAPNKSPKQPKANQRPILPKVPDLNKIRPKTETVTLNTQSVYPKLTTPDLLQKRVIDTSVETDIISREGSLLKPPILTTRPTVLKPFMVSSSESIHKSTSVTGPIINVPDLSKYKSLCKSSNSPHSLIASRSSPSNSVSRPKPHNTVKHATLSVPTTALPNTSLSSTGIVSHPKSTKSSNKSYSHSYAGKNVIITSELPLAKADLNSIMNTISTNPDFKKVPVLLSNGMAAALTIPASNNMSNSKTSLSSSVGSNQTIIVGAMPSLLRNRGNSSEHKEELKSHKSPKFSSTHTSISSSNSSQTNGTKTNAQKQTKNSEKGITPKSEPSPYDCIDID